jgi:hypothetical protein
MFESDQINHIKSKNQSKIKQSLFYLSFGIFTKQVIFLSLFRTYNRTRYSNH